MTVMDNSIESVLGRLQVMGLAMPDLPPKPIGVFKNAAHVGKLLYISGQGPVTPDGGLMSGKVGEDVDAETAKQHAAIVGTNILAVILQELGDFSRVKQIVKLLGMVNAVPEFTQHPYVINGCSELLGNVLHGVGQHARSAVGVGSLPNNITVEIEAIIEYE
jgi:enamine deaminase RidA (YjgF/YER057c/UK114 family)